MSISNIPWPSAEFEGVTISGYPGERDDVTDDATARREGARCAMYAIACEGGFPGGSPSCSWVLDRAPVSLGDRRLSWAAGYMEVASGRVQVST